MEIISYKSFINKSKKFYQNVAEQKIKTQQNIVNKLSVFNLKTGEINNIKYNLEYEEYNNYLYNSYCADLLDKEQQKQGNIALFCTFTLNSSYHPFSKKSPNKNYKYDIKDGYNLLNNFHRSIYKNFRINRKHIKVDFIKVVEAHKTYTPHLHTIYYVNPSNVKQFKQHLKQQIKKYELGKQYKIIQQNKDFINGDIFNNAIPYLLKYLKKSLIVENKDYSLIGWRKYHKIRIFSASYKTHIKRYIYKKISTQLQLKHNKKYINILQQYEDLVSVKIYININTQEKTLFKISKEYISKKNEYMVIVNKELQYRFYKEITQLHNYKLELDEIEYFYKLKHFKIYKNNYNNSELVYDKSDYITLSS